jgi:negative regulator of flagellin synthesis FlgM
MRVNDFGSSNRIGRYTNEPTPGVEEAAKKNGRASKAAVQENVTDTVELSSRSLEVVYARKIIEAAPEVRQDKVAEIKARIEAGTYEVKNEETATKLLTEALDEIL